MTLRTAQAKTGLTPPDMYLLRTIAKWDNYVEVARQTRITSGKADAKRLQRLARLGMIAIPPKLIPGQRVYAELSNSAASALHIWDQEADQ